MRLIEAGNTVALTACEATDYDGRNILISGLFELVEYEQSDPSVGLHADFWLVVAEGTPEDAPDDKWLAIDPWALLAQADPSAYAAELEAEREMDFVGEMMALADDGIEKPFFACPMGHPESFEAADRGHVFWPTGTEHGTMHHGDITVGIEHRCIHCGCVKWEVG